MSEPVFRCHHCGWTPKTPDNPPAKCGCFHAYWYAMSTKKATQAEDLLKRVNLALDGDPGDVSCSPLHEEIEDYLEAISE